MHSELNDALGKKDFPLAEMIFHSYFFKNKSSIKRLINAIYIETIEDNPNSNILINELINQEKELLHYSSTIKDLASEKSMTKEAAYYNNLSAKMTNSLKTLFRIKFDHLRRNSAELLKVSKQSFSKSKNNDLMQWKELEDNIQYLGGMEEEFRKEYEFIKRYSNYIITPVMPFVFATNPDNEINEVFRIMQKYAFTIYSLKDIKALNDLS